jgi:hypothetical protein
LSLNIHKMIKGIQNNSSIIYRPGESSIELRACDYPICPSVIVRGEIVNKLVISALVTASVCLFTYAVIKVLE